MAVENKPLHLFSDTRALRIYYYSDQTKYVDAVTTSAGGLTITPTVAGQTVTLANTAALSVGGTLTATALATMTAGFTTTSGNCYVGDSSNVNATLGLTINQGAADNTVLSLRSDDVAHGITAIASTNSYGSVLKLAATTGGMSIRGLSGATGGLSVVGSHTTDSVTKSTAGSAAVVLNGQLKSGTSVTACGADANLVAIQNNNTVRFLFDAEGSAHGDVGWVTYDDRNDLALIEDIEDTLAPGQVQRRFGEVVTHSRAFLEREGILHDVREEAGKTRGMMNMTRATMLAFGAIRQVYGRLARAEAALRKLLHDNPRIQGADRAVALLGG